MPKKLPYPEDLDDEPTREVYTHASFAHSPYRTVRACAGLQHWNPLTVKISRATAWSWGPFAMGHIQWGEKIYRIFCVGPCFSIWF